MPQLEAWQLVLVSPSFLNTQHGKLGCTTCHGGDPNTEEKAAAHANIVAAPSDRQVEQCGLCHGSVGATHVNSTHKNLAGYLKRIELRLGYSIENNPDLMQNFNKECGKCHASCGQCHVSRPASVNGGLVEGHNFYGRPQIKENCTACHGSRVGAEFFGENAGMKEDVHWIPNLKRCEFCHPAEELHGTGEKVDYRYNVPNAPRCENCHGDKATANLYHNMHWNSTFLPKLACQVCHSQDYKSCNSCHTGGAGITGSSYLSFKIGKNYLKSTQRNYDYTTVRHIPIAPDTYASWGLANLPNFDAEPTWKYATPHNIQRWTARTQVEPGKGCGSNCHDSDFYLTEKDLEDYEKDANKNVIIGN